MSNEKIVEAMELTPLVPSTKKEIAVIKSDSDYEAAKGNLEHVLSEVFDAISEVSEIAKQSQETRAYRVLNELLNTALQASKAQMEIKQMDVQVKLAENQQDQPQTINQNLFVGSTAELADLLEKAAKKKTESIAVKNEEQ